ncbi:MAG TPA: matrixin family metalloprotease [Vicinamibacterales bacterium]|nr:matrixin family metalloprotease [Vicinamibacterales bacterium]
MTRRPAALLIAVALAVAAFSTDALAYLKLGVRQGGRLITLKFNTLPVRYFVTNRDVPGVTAAQLRDAAGRAFAAWAAVPNVRLSSEFVGFTGAAPLTGDSANVLGFTARPDLDRVLGSTSFTVDSVSGEIVESDIFFNSLFAWSAASGGEPGRQDIESIVLHEVGHMLGLGHSMLGETELIGTGRRVISAEAVMFPIAFSAGVVNRAPRADDMAGIADIYGTDVFRTSAGSIAGRVTKNGTGVLGAHVVAFSPATGKLVGGFSLSQDGSFVIGALEAGTYVLRAEPLDDGDVTSFLESSLTVDADFKPAFYERLVTVPRGGTSRSVEIKVVAK